METNRIEFVITASSTHLKKGIDDKHDNSGQNKETERHFFLFKKSDSTVINKSQTGLVRFKGFWFQSTLQF